MAEILDFNRTPELPEPLWREALGRKLRETREARGDRLVDVAERAGISVQYLSEIERGRKEPSSEMIAAVTGALGVDLADLLISIAGQVRHFQRARTQFHTSRPVGRPSGPVAMAFALVA
ncbi:helix-turn-helix transcriptional regulator [Lentzea sp. BCCO 10_0856]|uniref:Helix-turn-helix transcriptional regulator n=1 Tax=Lentzea miocenica TaxID=3095431 RepID=A0ABU4TCH4_9PSEU|nr:helix-turn-helix transcriptional regulator [Lentzea sp. BCCO 10_0856]MDX8035881.1 helix-turn-helix transcriptional regulator [Lentzea sp. BCCO 10_0856]